MVTPSLILTAAQNLCADNQTQIGFTTTKKLGKAHIRNKARRRLRALARTHLAGFLPAVDYVLIGRHNTADIEFAQLQKDFLWGLKKLNTLLTEKKDETRPSI